jgi:ferrous iron transport protein B
VTSAVAPSAPVQSPPPAKISRIALVGNPNTGKTTLFNLICGARAKVANFPGTTTTMRAGRWRVPGRQIDVVDLPGVYDLRYNAPESRICRELLTGQAGHRPDAVLVVVDACNLTRNLVLVGELLAFDLPVVVLLNMMDLANRRGLSIDAGAMQECLGTPVIPIVARTGDGVARVERVLGEMPTTMRGPTVLLRPPAEADLESLTTWAEAIVERSVAGGGGAVPLDTLTERLDRTFTHPVLGLLSFAVVMGALFYTLFALATVPMDLIEATFAWLGDLARTSLPEGAIRDLITDGIVGGVAGTVVFLPQICLLFFLISLLEDTGYLARAAFVMDRLLYRFGLPGQAFVPLLTAHACALPAIMSTRLIPDRRDRLATILVAPFMSCSARLPVYVLLTGLIVADRPAAAAAAFVGCYLLGGTAALLSAVLFGRTVLEGRARPMVLELPTYRTPSFMNALLTAKDQGLNFLRTAGTVIVAICIVMWWLSAYPKVGPDPSAEALRARAEQTAITPEQAALWVAEADLLQVRAEQAGSFAGRIGQLLEPAFRPLGFDWQLTVGVLTSFLAREVFVSTMSVLAGGSGDAEVDEGVLERIRTMTRSDGTLVFTMPASAAALVFFVLAMQCLPTLAVTRRETGQLKYAMIQLGYMSGLAYVAALLVHQGLRMAGFA